MHLPAFLNFYINIDLDLWSLTFDLDLSWPLTLTLSPHMIYTESVSAIDLGFISF